MSDKNHDLLELIETKRRCEDLEKENNRLLEQIKELKRDLSKLGDAYCEAYRSRL